ncbi:MAG: hypothetical protein DI551_01950 [Micavibrio aeruginosavorus]|uniref:Carboxypeptidase regulatory-like domain-containing protein n=1 Tax=Micavibrio aeruginosavorus TaxID=349221 RepID=A0A2W5NC10_9BACT|nr:MAG: hypothetical protein DI551_01950 [Micavibrio aeruginosavorus]
MRFRCILLLVFILLPMPRNSAFADVTSDPSSDVSALSMQDRLSLAREFVQKISKGLAKADRQMASEGNKADVSGMEEGEELLFRVRLTKKLAIESPVLARVHNDELVISFRDFITALDFPIKVGDDGLRAQGWYIRENKTFDLDANLREVVTADGTYKMSDNVVAADQDVFVPAAELSKWFGFNLEPDVAGLDIQLHSPLPLPVQDRLEREKFKMRNRKIGPPELPLMAEEPRNIDYPFVDVINRTSYEKDGDGGKGQKRSDTSVRTTGDVMQGTLTTLSQFELEDKLRSARVTYKRESREAELLGPLKARRFEIGDVVNPTIPLRTHTTQGLGARVSNSDPLRNTLRPTTQITGNSLPGWDVELYKNDALIAYQRVGDDGLYIFDNVDLFRSDNNFRVVMYGPQGEIREENVYIPVDSTRLSEDETAYDVSLTANQKQTYRKQKIDDEDVGAPSLSAIIEKPIGERSAVSTGLEVTQENGEDRITGHAGVSTDIAQTLFNLDTAVEHSGEAAARFVARKDLGRHQLRNEVNIATDRFNDYEEDNKEYNIFSDAAFSGLNENTNEVFSNRFSVNGPLDLSLGKKPRYNLLLDYAQEADGDAVTQYQGGLGTSFKNLSVNQQLNYTQNDSDTEDELYTVTNLTGRVAGNRLRLLSQYDIKPESKLNRILATGQRYIRKDMELELGVQHRFDPRLTEGRAQVNWKAGFADISPAVTYNTDRDFTATLNTRIGLAKDPLSNSIKTFDRTIASSGGISAFVFLDKNGDNEFNNDDEPLPEVQIYAPQNGGREFTGGDGYAFFNNLRKLKPTDVYVNSETLKDPYWVSGFEGVSIIPREGHVTALNFPIHTAGSIDGSVYMKPASGESSPIRDVKITLYSQDGVKVRTALSEPDGYYLLDRIPPGDYYLAVDDEGYGMKMARSLPQHIHIGYEGTIIYANNIYLQEGRPDVPLVILAGNEAKAGGDSFLLNLGSYKSQLMMGIVWFKLRSWHGALLHGADVVKAPSQSLPEEKSKKYTLRLRPKINNLEESYKICAAIVRSGESCSVEIMPGSMQQIVASR